jgi:hypothetical protein
MKKLLFLFVIYCYSANTIAQKCTSGDCANGVGTYVFDNGNTYTGSFKNDKRDGKGVFTWVDGTVYNGDWVQGVKTGSGTNKYVDGTLYIGEFENNTMTGKGTYTLANGFSMKGIFKENVGVDVKYFDNKNNEISKETYLKSEREVNENYKLQSKSKLQIQNLTIPAPNGAYSMTDRAEDVKMEFSSFNNNFLYLWGNTPNLITINDAKVAARSSYETLTKTDVGRMILADFNKSSSSTNDSYSPHFKQKGFGYANHKFQIKINKGKPFGINNDSTFDVTLYNYQKFIDDETIKNFSFWKNSDERKAYHKKEKDIYFDFLKSDGRDNKYIKEVYENKNKTKLTDIHASYDSIKSMAHVVFTFTHLKYSQSYNVMYDIDFKNKTYKKIAESDFEAKVNDDCYTYLASITEDKTTKKWFRNYKIINFDDNSTININQAYIEKLNNLTNPPREVEFITSNKEYLLFESKKGYPSYAEYSYYFVNKKNNFCEKIVTLKTGHEGIGWGNIVWNNDFSNAAFSRRYKLNSSDQNSVTIAYIIDFENLSVQLIDDYQYQQDAINNKIIQDKEDSLQAAIKSQEVYSRNAEITRQNAEIDAQNAQAKAERRSKCTCCHGTGQETKLGMYMGQESITTVSVNGLQQKSTTSVPVYGSSTIVECSCCK